MLPDPLHPAVVHIPIALAVLLPLLCLAAAIAIHRGWLQPRAWSAIVLLGAVLVGASWFALETGEHEEDRVERVVAEKYIEEHEEAAETFMVLAGVFLALAATGLMAGRRGEIGRLAATLLAFGLLAGGARVGHLGGELVYEHGAASAYQDGSAGDAGSHADHGHDDDD